MSEKALRLAQAELQKAFMRFCPDIAEQTAEELAAKAVSQIEWDNPALMHKDLNWIAKDYLRTQKIA